MRSDGRRFGSGHHDGEHTEHRNRWIGQGKDDAELGLDEARLRSPAEQRRRPDDEASGLFGKDQTEPIENLGSGGDRVTREKELIQPALLERLAQLGWSKAPG